MVTRYNPFKKNAQVSPPNVDKRKNSLDVLAPNDFIIARVEEPIVEAPSESESEESLPRRPSEENDDEQILGRSISQVPSQHFSEVPRPFDLTKLQQQIQQPKPIIPGIGSFSKQ